MANECCFVCGSDNPFGLHIEFIQHGDGVEATFVCDERHVGWPGIQHGGITGALLDEACGYIPHQLGLLAMTAELNISFLQPIHVGERVHISAKPTKITRRVIEVEAFIEGVDGVMKARSTGKMLVLSAQQQADAGLVPQNQP